MRFIGSELDSIQTNLRSNAAQLTELGEESFAQKELQRAESIDKFIQQNKAEATDRNQQEDKETIPQAADSLSL